MLSNYLMESDNAKIYQLSCSPSSIPNNLGINEKNLYFIHNSEYIPRIMAVDKHIFVNPPTENPSTIPSFDNSETCEMLCFKIIQFGTNNYVAIGLYGGFKLWSIDGKRILFQIPAKVKKENRIYAFTSIAQFQANSTSKGYDSLVCGDNYGQIFHVQGQASNWKSKIISESKEGVIALASFPGLNIIAVSYEDGKILFLQYKNNVCGPVASFDNDDMISLVLACIKGENGEIYLGAGMTNGEIQIYNMKNFSLEITIHSHLRTINSLIGYENCFISGGNDGVVNIWKVKDEKKVTLEKNYVFEDKMITGIEYSKEQKELYVSSYDFPEIIVIPNITL